MHRGVLGDPMHYNSSALGRPQYGESITRHEIAILKHSQYKDVLPVRLEGNFTSDE